MMPRRPRHTDEDPDLGLIDFPSEADERTPAVPSRPWRPAAAAEIAGDRGGGDAPWLQPIGNEAFLSEEPLLPGAAVTADIVPVGVAAARSALPPNPMPRVITFGVYAMLAMAGAAVGWFAVSFRSTLEPEATNAALETSAQPEWVPLATLHQPVHDGSIRLANRASEEEDVEARVGGLVAPSNAPNVPSKNQAARPATPIPVRLRPTPPQAAVGTIPGEAASGSNAAPPPVVVPPVSAPAAMAGTAPPSTAEIPKLELPRSEPPRTASAPTEVPRAAALPEAPRPAASPPDLPRAEAARRRETGLIETVLDRYVGAFNTLDAEAARAVWPGVDARALDRVFTQLEEQELTFEECKVELDEARAMAVCRGVARYVPRVGSRSSRSTARQWTFTLQKAEDRWTIDGVSIR